MNRNLFFSSSILYMGSYILKHDFFASSSYIIPGSRRVEICCHGFGPHPTLCVHGCVHHWDGCRFCWEIDWAQHAVEFWPINKQVWYQSGSAVRLGEPSEVLIIRLCLFSSLSITLTHKQKKSMLSFWCCSCNWLLWSHWVILEVILVTNNFSIFDLFLYSVLLLQCTLVNAKYVLLLLCNRHFSKMFFLAAWLMFGSEDWIPS